MPTAVQSDTLERPREVDVGAIESEFMQLWKRATDDREGAEGGLAVRACTLNFVVVTEDAARLQAIEQLVGAVTLEHPGRIFLIHVKRGNVPDKLTAWISARCVVPVPGGKQVCCEQITLQATGREVSKLPSIVASLLVPDIPTILLWKGEVDAADPLLASLSELVDRLLIDSSEEPDAIRVLTSWVNLFSARGEDVLRGDLAWAHVTPWRAALAQTFSLQATRAYLDQIAGLQIAISTTSHPAHSGASQALLVISWLADRLHWSVSTRVGGSSAGGYEISLNAHGGPIACTVIPRPATIPGPGGIEEIRMTTRPGVVISWASGEERSCIRSTVTTPDGHRSEGALWARDRDEMSIVAQELEVLDRDPQYIAAIQVLRSLLKAGR